MNYVELSAGEIAAIVCGLCVLLLLLCGLFALMWWLWRLASEGEFMQPYFIVLLSCCEYEYFSLTCIYKSSKFNVDVCI